MRTSVFDADVSRRDFLRLSAGAAAVMAVGSVMPSTGWAQERAAAAAKRPLTECLTLTPEQMAKQSPMVQKGYTYLLECSKQISDRKVRAVIEEGLKQPKPKLLELFPTTAAKERLRQELTAAGYIKADVTHDQILPPAAGPQQLIQPFYAAPGSGWKSHHAYPGGLVTHVAVDMQTALGIYDAYEDIYGYRMNKELIMAAILIHDIQKTWVLQWQADGSCLPEVNVAGTGVHHILAIADAMHRELSPELIVAIACSHNHPGFAADEAQVVGWIKAAALYTGRDPVREGLLAADGQTLPLPRRQEGFMVHLGDHDYVLTAPAAGWVTAQLAQLAKTDYGMSEQDLQGRPFYMFRNYIFTQLEVLRLHQLWVERGEAGLRAAITKLIGVS